MDFRWTAEESEILLQARKTIGHHLPIDRLLSDAGAASAWQAVGADGWFSSDAMQMLPETSPDTLLAGIAIQAGRHLTGDGFVNNAVVLQEILAGCPGEGWLDGLVERPGFLIADGRSNSYVGSAELPMNYCAGVEPGLWAYLLTADNQLRIYAPGSWDSVPTGGLGLGWATVSLRPEAVPVSVTRLATGHDRVSSRSITTHAATLVGLGDAALEQTVTYVKQRIQFGRPIGSFQAVKHVLADVAVSLEVALTSVAFATLRPGPDSAAVAHLHGARAAEAAAQAMTQLIGGIAVTWEHTAHLYLKTALLSTRRFGTPSAFATQVARTRSTA